MGADCRNTQYLLTLPSRMAAAFERLEQKRRPQWYATCDPAERKLGSGGGTAHLLAAAWRETGADKTFPAWLQQSRKLILHAGGQSRRLPAYAPTGKILMPLPVFRCGGGQRLDQTLLDLQLPDYDRVLAHAGPRTVAMVTSGDVLLRFGSELPVFPEVDVLGLGMWVEPARVKDFGVFCVRRDKPEELAFFLQKPPAEEVWKLSKDHLCLVDTGMWLLSERAVEVLMQCCGWDSRQQTFGERGVLTYELYAQFGLCLGSRPRVEHPAINQLTSAVIPLPEAEFYHFGTSAQLVQSTSALQNLGPSQSRPGAGGSGMVPDQHVLSSRFEHPIGLESNHTLWIENSHIPGSWRLACNHVLTGVPANEWALQLEPGVCLDFVPIGPKKHCIRTYGFSDPFAGPLADASTRWLGRPLAEWFSARGITLAEAGLPPTLDIQSAALFPVLAPEAIESGFLSWLFAAAPAPNPRYRAAWIKSPRLSASEICAQVSLERLRRQRLRNTLHCVAPLMRNARYSAFHRLDLKATAALYAASDRELPPPASAESSDGLLAVHDAVFRAEVLRQRRQRDAALHEARAFGALRATIIREAQLTPVTPQRRIQEDQIVWACSPVRLDLAGGWTDTPPYCLEYGGRVLNLAVDLNGQPPIQVFAKLCPRPEVVLRSIDLGVEERISSYEGLAGYDQPGNAFALAKAGLALAGFLPGFHPEGGFKSLAQQLRKLGGGLEISMLCAVPKGSGLGTSSILAATLLAALSDLCGLNWDSHVLFTRTLALEQMLTTGGGWQDQAGAIFRGVKLIETAAGLAQTPTLRWLPSRLFGPEYANRTALLYYTGITRMAKGILQEIVRGIFLNSAATLQTIGQIGRNAEQAARAVQWNNYDGLAACLRESWRLNQALDRGTNPPAVQQILEPIRDYVAGGKLLGAGGGGYLLLLAKDEEAAKRIRLTLRENPPNSRARFVDFSLSETGLEVTRS